MADYDLFQIEITKNYTVNEWREDIKKVHIDLLYNSYVLALIPLGYLAIRFQYKDRYF